MDLHSLVSVVIWMAIVGLIFYVLWWGLGQLALPEPMNKIARVILVVFMVVVLLYFLVGFLPPMPGNVRLR